jgi:hypothetical protein
MHSARRMNVAWCVVHGARCIVQVACCTLHAARCTLRIARCALHAVHCTLHVARCALHAARCTLCIARCALHAARYMMWPRCPCNAAQGCPLLGRHKAAAGASMDGHGIERFALHHATRAGTRERRRIRALARAQKEQAEAAASASAVAVRCRAHGQAPVHDRISRGMARRSAVTESLIGPTAPERLPMPDRPAQA